LARYRNANPERFRRALQTARKSGHGGVVAHSRYTTAKRRRSKRSHARRTSGRR
jgi:hypothetical protein